MGHLINPISNRLSINAFWNSTWVLINNFNFINMFKKDYILFQFLNFFLRKSRYSRFNVLVSHYKIFRLTNNIFINFYYYNANMEEKKYKYQVIYLAKLLKRQKRKNNFFNVFKTSYLVTTLEKTFRRKNKNGKSIWTNVIKKLPTLDKKLERYRIKIIYKYMVKTLVSNIFWTVLKETINFYLNKLSRSSIRFHFNSFSLNFFGVTPQIISIYLSLRLQQKYSLNWTLRPVLKDLTIKVKNNIIAGFKIVCSGRFTRKQIATYIWNKQGALRFNNFSNHIKYSESTARLKYGLCGIKVWINYGFNDTKIWFRRLFFVYPKYTPFKYMYNIKEQFLALDINYWFYLYLKISFLKKYTINICSIFMEIKTKTLIKGLINKIYKLNSKFNINYVGSVLKLRLNKPLIRIKDLFVNITKIQSYSIGGTTRGIVVPNKDVLYHIANLNTPNKMNNKLNKEYAK